MTTDTPIDYDAFTMSEEAHYFDSARDAIDAVSAFEASTLNDYEYRIETNGTAWRVHMNNIDSHRRGYLKTLGRNS